jgi:tetratricopeptide (TPR) repeat protein
VPGGPGDGEVRDAEAIRVDQAQGMLVGDYGMQSNRFARATTGRDAYVAGGNIHLHVEVADGRTVGGVAEEQRPVLAGQPLEQVTDPFALGVHPVIDADAGIPGLAALPFYVRRAHDAIVEKTVRRAAAGASAIAVLVGSSSAGKTRTCWEALAPLREAGGWRLWRPADAGTALGELGQVTARTVIWLDETRGHHLSTLDDGAGGALASALRELLHDPARSPVLALVTMWHSHWGQLTTEPSPGSRGNDPHAHARSLLTGHGIPVPSAFTAEEDLLAVRTAGARDARLAEARAQAKDGEITQYLAGVPVLLERYRLAADGARALILAALDARRMGHGRELPVPLLEAAAPGYLSDTQWQRLAQNPAWLEDALAETGSPCRGTPGLLARVHQRPGAPESATPCYAVADYLEQREGASRQATATPTALWEALVSHHATRADAKALAVAAQNRGLWRYAYRLYTAAARAGDPEAFSAVAGMLERADRIDEAITWRQRYYEEAESAGSRTLEYAAEQVARLLEREGRVGETLTWWQRAAEAGNDLGPERALHLMEEAGQFGEAVEWLLCNSERLLPGPGTQAGQPDTDLKAYCAVRLARMLVRTGRLDEAMEWWHRALTADKMPFAWAGDVIIEAGQEDAARAWLREHASTISANAAELMERDLATARASAREPVKPPQPRQVQAGGKQAADPGKPPGQAKADARERRLRAFPWKEFGENFTEGSERVLGILRRDIENGHFVGYGYSLDLATDLLWVTGRPSEAIEWCKRAAENPETERDNATYATSKAAELLVEAGRTSQAISWLQASAVGRADWYAMEGAVALLLQADQAREAITWLQSCASAGQHDALHLSAHVLEKTGRRHDSELLRKYGWEPDGTIAKPWPAPLPPTNQKD